MITAITFDKVRNTECYLVYYAVSMSSTPPSSPNPTSNNQVTLDAQGVLDFIAKQTKNDRDYFDSLLKWFGIPLAVAAAVFTFFGINTYQQIKQIRDDVQKEARAQLQIAISAEFQRDKIETAISTALKEKTQTEFKTAIDQAVVAELAKPENRTLIREAVRQEIARQLIGRRLSKEQQAKIALYLSTPSLGKVEVMSPEAEEQNRYAKDFQSALELSAWKNQVVFSSVELPIAFEGVVIIVTDPAAPNASALALMAALKAAHVSHVRFSSCINCAESPKSDQVWLYVGSKVY